MREIEGCAVAGHGENRVTTARIDSGLSLFTSAAHPLRKGKGGGETDSTDELTKSAAMREWVMITLMGCICRMCISRTSESFSKQTIMRQNDVVDCLPLANQLSQCRIFTCSEKCVSAFMS